MAPSLFGATHVMSAECIKTAEELWDGLGEEDFAEPEEEQVAELRRGRAE